jgi:UDP-N-acetylmuramoylalanine--D-glutamate ligase
MDLITLKNKKLVFLGLGIENYALIKYFLKKKVKCAMTICDLRSEKQLGEKYSVLKLRKNIHWKFGESANRGLDSFDIIFRSPGWPLFNRGVIEAKKAGVKVTSALELFLAICPTKNIVGVTGSKGKGTTASLIRYILRQAKRRVWLGGNIGVAPFSFITEIRKNDWIILELSSFQLEDLKYSPHIAVLTNFFSEHLSPADPNNPNYHRSLRDYWQAKLKITSAQTKRDWLVVNENLKKKIKSVKINSRIKFFTKEILPSKLVGEHNKENVAAAVTVAKIIGIPEKIIVRAVASFSGLEHRLELVAKIKNIAYYNDSFATTPESTIIALQSFNQPIVLLAGGADKGSSFKELARVIKGKVKFLVLFQGVATPRLKREVEKTGFKKTNIKVAKNMKEAVHVAKKNAKSNEIILMSPACASFGMFKNYKERGCLFKKEV